jgi:hypothetical protein
MAEGPVTTQQTGREECGETTNEDGAPAKVHARIAADIGYLPDTPEPIDWLDQAAGNQSRE